MLAPLGIHQVGGGVGPLGPRAPTRVQRTRFSRLLNAGPLKAARRPAAQKFGPAIGPLGDRRWSQRRATSGEA